MAASSEHAPVALTASCLCKAHVFTTNVPESALPIESWICHCTSCRRVSGALYTHDAVWPGAHDGILGSDLVRYPMTKNVKLLFCGRCSTPMFWWEQFEGQPEVLDVLIGALECSKKDSVVKTTRNGFVGDTCDGGAAPWLRSFSPGQEDIPTWSGSPGTSELLGPDWPHTTGQEQDCTEESRTMDQIPVVCHCRGVNLVLRHGGADFSAMPRDKLPWFVNPKTHKLLASFDACDSCRKSFGVSVMNWTFALLKHIAYPEEAGTSPFPTTTRDLKAAVSGPDRDQRLGTLAVYESSPDVQRYFCSRCSASVMYAVDARPDMVDLSVGLLDAPDGARAESWLQWALGSPASWKKDAEGTWREDFVQTVQDNSEAWRVRTGRDVIWHGADK